MRESTATTWFSDQLTEIGDGIQMYLTGQNGDNTKLAVDGVGGTKEQLDSDKDRSGLNAQFQPGRPNVTQLVRRAAEQYSGRIGVMGEWWRVLSDLRFSCHGHSLKCFST
jgi:hypothetical protein